MWTIPKVFIEFVSVLWFGFMAMSHVGSLTSWPGIKPPLPVLEGEVLTKEVPDSIVLLKEMKHQMSLEWKNIPEESDIEWEKVLGTP